MTVVGERELLEVALWTGYGHNEDGTVTETLDALFTIGDIPTEEAESLVEDWADFLKANREDVQEYLSRMGYHTSDYGTAAHDFHLSRNAHGAGFWDRGLGELGERLSKAARAYGTAELIVDLNDDGEPIGTMYLTD